MPKIFISYRRHDSADVTKRLHGRLANEFDLSSTTSTPFPQALIFASA